MGGGRPEGQVSWTGAQPRGLLEVSREERRQKRQLRKRGFGVSRGEKKGGTALRQIGE